MLEYSSTGISQAILQTLLYSDVFDFPLTGREVHRYLEGVPATYEEVLQILTSDPRIAKTDAFFTLTGREETVYIRMQRETYSRALLPHALRYGRILGSLPFIRMVALTGSLAVMNVAEKTDFDYMLVTHPGRLWAARAFALLLGRITSRWGHTICPNLLVAEDSLEWHQHDLYSARELCQMIPITGMNVYRKLMKANEWIKVILPNAIPQLNPLSMDRVPRFQHFIEIPLRGKTGDRFEVWEMNRKIARFSRQAGYGEETIFNARLCQGNFDHHRRWTQDQLRERSGRYEVREKAV